MGTVIVEADIKSGAMMTADAALDQGRSVFAVPGRIDQPGAHGPHRLIRNGARLVEDIDDILQEFEMLLPTDPVRKAAALDSLPRVQLSGDPFWFSMGRMPSLAAYSADAVAAAYLAAAAQYTSKGIFRPGVS